MTDSKIKSNSLYQHLKDAGLIDAFFEYVASEEPGYKELHKWCVDHNVRTSIGALHTCITYHMAVWRAKKAEQSVEEQELTLPPGIESKVRERLRGLRLDLSLRDLSEKTAVTLLKLDLAERELAAKQQATREAGVDALIEESRGNAKAEAALKAFFEALDEAKQ